MPSVDRIRPRTEQFIALYKYLDYIDKLPDLKTVASIIGYTSLSSISDILARRMNVRQDALVKFIEHFKKDIPEAMLGDAYAAPSGNIFRNIKFIREYLELSQTDFGEKVGATKTMIQSYESGKAHPKMIVLEKIAEMIGLSIQQISFAEITLADMRNDEGAGKPSNEVATSPQSNMLVISEDDLRRLITECVNDALRQFMMKAAS